MVTNEQIIKEKGCTLSKPAKEIKLEGIFDLIENAMTWFYHAKGLEKIRDIPFNTFEMSLFIEEYLKYGNRAVERLIKEEKKRNGN